MAKLDWMGWMPEGEELGPWLFGGAVGGSVSGTGPGVTPALTPAEREIFSVIR